MASNTPHINTGKRTSAAVAVLLSSLATASPATSENAILRLPTLYELPLEVLLSIRIIPDHTLGMRSIEAQSASVLLPPQSPTR